ncbi:hypothetical protein [Fusobacterium sp. SYSU M8A802]
MATTISVNKQTIEQFLLNARRKLNSGEREVRITDKIIESLKSWERDYE